MLWHGRYQFVLALPLLAAVGRFGKEGADTSIATESDEALTLSTVPLVVRAPSDSPTQEEIEAERELLLLLSRILCFVIRCDPIPAASSIEWTSTMRLVSPKVPTPPPEESTPDELGVRLETYRTEGLLPNLSTEDLESGLEAVLAIADLLTGPFASYLIEDEPIRQLYLDTLADLQAHLLQELP